MSLFLDLLFPLKCLSCSRSGYYLCPTCFSLLPKNSLETNSLSLYKYQYPLTRLISTLKYDFVTDLIPQLVDTVSSDLRTLFPNLLSYWQSNSFTLVPIPLHPLRQNYRGFNQSELLAHQLSQKLSLPYSPHLLKRIRHQAPQASLPNKQLRLHNLDSSFSLQSIPPPNLILFDDVKTTGSTLKSASTLLKSTYPSLTINTLTLAA